MQDALSVLAIGFLFGCLFGGMFLPWLKRKATERTTYTGPK